MTARAVLWCAVVLMGSSLSAQTQSTNPPSQSELAAVSERGRALAGYDAAAWHATDAVEPLAFPRGTFERYIATKTDKGWLVSFGRFNQAKTEFLVVCEAMQQSTSSTQYTVTKHEPPLEDSDALFRAAKAHELATAEFLRDVKPQRPYNISILPASSGDWYVYALPAQTDLAVLPYGGDIRYTVSADGTNILEKRQMHKTVLEEKVSSTLFNFHTHVLSSMPEDSDVFYALTRKAAQGEWIVTKQYSYQLTPEGSLSYLGKTDEIPRLLQEGKYESIPGPNRSMVLSATRRLLEGVTSGNPLEAFVSLLGARCANSTVWLKFLFTVHNIGETRVILHKDALQNSQVQFAATDADILANKYEKLAFFTPSEAELSNENSFWLLGPGMVHTEEREYPILGLDLKGKAAFQFLLFTWPLTEENQAETQRARWKRAGFLYTDPIATPPSPLTIDRKLLESCIAK